MINTLQKFRFLKSIDNFGSKYIWRLWDSLNSKVFFVEMGKGVRWWIENKLSNKKRQMLGLSMKILLLILWETTVSYSQSPCSPLRHFPYPYVETGTIAPLINGSHTGGTFYFTVIYNNNYLTHVPRPTNPILGIKTFKSKKFLMIASSLSTYVNFALVSSNFTYTSMMVGVSIGVGYWIQYIQINYVVDSIGAKGVSFGSFGFYVRFL